MVAGYLKQSFIQNISRQKNSKLHEITITRSGKGKKSISPVLLMRKCRQTIIIILFSRNSYKNDGPSEQRGNKITLRSTPSGWNKF